MNAPRASRKVTPSNTSYTDTPVLSSAGMVRIQVRKVLLGAPSPGPFRHQYNAE
jgi:hypothetical protein